MDVVIVQDAGCPNVELARERVAEAMRRAGVEPTWRELDRDDPRTPSAWRRHASPTVLVDGEDVAPGAEGHCACRLYALPDGRFGGAPAVETIVAAIHRARAGTKP